jgi:hypothetical protein
MKQVSDNGWPHLAPAETASRIVPGTTMVVHAAPGALWILCKFAELFNELVEPLDGPIRDDWSYADRPVRGSTVNLSCHASGTAIDLNALLHPRGVKNTFSPDKVTRIRALLKKFTIPGADTSCIKWGNDFKAPSIIDQMHFQIQGTRLGLLRVQSELEDDMTPEQVTAAVVAALKERLIPNPPLDPKVPIGPEYTFIGILQNIETTQDKQQVLLTEILAALKAK